MSKELCISCVDLLVCMFNALSPYTLDIMVYDDINNICDVKSLSRV